MSSYLKAWEVVLAPPWPALIGLGISFAVLRASRWLGRWLGRGEWVDSVSALSTVCGLVGGALHAVALAGLVHFGLLRWLGWAIAGLGWTLALAWLARQRGLPARARNLWQRTVWSERALSAVLAAAGLGLLLLALGPATDADSLDYHLGAPLEWLRRGVLEGRQDWIHLRLTGIGEGLNLLGLAAGTDGLGALLQLLGGFGMAAALAERARDRTGRLLGAVLVLGAPVLLALVSTQKPQLLPATGVAAAGLLLWDRRPLRPGDFVLACGALGFALGCKYSFLFSVAVVGALGIRALRTCERKALAAGLGVGLFVLLAAPVYLRNVAFWGDPLSPMLEQYKANPDSRAVAYAEYIRQLNRPEGGRGFLSAIVGTVATTRPGLFSTVLGVGSLAFLCALRARDRRNRDLLLLAAAHLGLAGALGAVHPRYLLEAYLWASAAAVSATPSTIRRILLLLTGGQTALVAAAALAASVRIGPALVDAGARERLLGEQGFGWSVARWADETLPTNAVILSDVRSRYLLPRPFLASYVIGWADDPTGTAALARLVRTGKVTHLLLTEPAYDPRLLAVTTSCTTLLAPKFESTYASRNPFNRGDSYAVGIYEIQTGLPGCSSALERVNPQLRTAPSAVAPSR